MIKQLKTQGCSFKQISLEQRRKRSKDIYNRGDVPVVIYSQKSHKSQQLIFKGQKNYYILSLSRKMRLADLLGYIRTIIIGADNSPLILSIGESIINFNHTIQSYENKTQADGFVYINVLQQKTF